MEKVKVINGGFPGGFWLAGWLFTIGYLHLVMPQVLYAVIVWPYYLGVAFGAK